MTSNDMKALGIRPLDVQFILLLQDLQSHFGVVNQVQLGNHMGYSVKTAERSIRRLRDVGWLISHRTGSKTWRYEVTDICPFISCKVGGLEGSHFANQKRISGRCEPSNRSILPETARKCVPPKSVVDSKFPQAGKPVPSKSAVTAKLHLDEMRVHSNGHSVPSSHTYLYESSLYTRYYTYCDCDIEYITEHTREINVENEFEEDHNIWPVRTPELKASSQEELFDEEEDMAEPKIIGSDDGPLAELKRRLQSGESYFQGKRKKTNLFKNLSAPPDEFNKEEIINEKQEQRVFSVETTFRKAPAKKEKAKYNQADMWYVYKRCWKESGLNGNPIPWTIRDRANVKELIEEQGSEAIVTFIEYCFKNWDKLALQCGIRSIAPSIRILYGFRHTMIPAALNPEKSIVRVGYEYNGDAGIPNGEWTAPGQPPVQDRFVTPKSQTYVPREPTEEEIARWREHDELLERVKREEALKAAQYEKDKLEDLARRVEKDRQEMQKRLELGVRVGGSR